MLSLQENKTYEGKELIFSSNSIISLEGRGVVEVNSYHEELFVSLKPKAETAGVELPDVTTHNELSYPVPEFLKVSEKITAASTFEVLFTRSTKARNRVSSNFFVSFILIKVVTFSF